MSAAICVGSQHLTAMTIVTAVVIGARLALFATLPAKRRDHSLRAELAFLLLCTVLGAANDWNSVTRHRIYDYTVPVEWPEASLIPVWMLLYWGLILRFVSSLFRWQRLRIAAPRDDAFGHFAGRSGIALRIVGMLALVVGTRQAIYRTYMDGLWSWLPFAAALVIGVLLLRPGRRRMLTLVVFGTLGPAVEALYIQVGSLHAYHLGWLSGVPLWIALWWMLSALFWGELSARLLRYVTAH
ncbi:MAG: hypothetical protein R3B13_25215 [Polyangiaceae bacterium]